MTAVCPFAHQNLYYSRSGDRQKHACYTKKVPCNTDCKKHEEGMKTCGCTDYFWIDVVGVKLLHEKQSHDDHKSQSGATVEEGNQKGGYHTEEGTEIRNYVENTTYYADYYGKFYIEESQHQGGKKCHYKAVH